MKKEALIIFLKYPELGRSKTRLAAAVGDENALKIYKALLAHTKSVTENLSVDKFLFYDQVSSEKMPWSESVFRVAYQQSGDLGQRMESAFNQLFADGYERILIIGSDCYELTQRDIESAFVELEKKAVVIGPANDGGYYMLGLTTPIPRLFKNITWSTGDVFSTTISILETLKIDYHLSPTLSDVDTIDDLPDELRNLIS